MLRASGNFTFECNIVEMELFGSFLIDKSPYGEENSGKWIQTDTKC